MRLRRSCLAVPGSNPKMLAKAAALPADMVFLDLEDAVAPLEKNDATRQNVVDALTGHEWTAPTRVVRVNDVSTVWCFRDILAVVSGAKDSLDCLMIPKVQGPDQVAFVHHLLNQLEAELGMTKRIGLEIQIESARGAENLPAIAGALEAGGNSDYQIVKLAHLNHLFQTAQIGAPAEYSKIEETFAPVALQVMGDWIVRHVK